MATKNNFQISGMTQIKRKLQNAGFTLIPLRHLMNEHSEVIVEEAKKLCLLILASYRNLYKQRM
jgi:hypothetical protein